MRSNDHEAALAALRAELHAIRHHGEALSGHEQWLTDHSKILTEYGHALDRMNKWIARLERGYVDYVDGHSGEHQELRHRLDEVERTHSVQVFMDWIKHARLAANPRVSVIMPTYNRSAFLPAAIASVTAQAHPNWELVIVDDASTDGTAEFLSTVEDRRVRPLRVEHGGVCAARNAGLAAATGEIVAYLDDDNIIMHPYWLKSVVWALEQRPDIDVVYGAFVLDDVERVNRRGAGALPRMFLRPYDRATLLRENLADISAIAHRAGLPGARFDESLIEMGDWDLLCTLTADRDPLVLPAISCFHTTDAPNRLSGGATYDADHDAVRRKHASEGTAQ